VTCAVLYRLIKNQCRWVLELVVSTARVARHPETSLLLWRLNFDTRMLHCQGRLVSLLCWSLTRIFSKSDPSDLPLAREAVTTAEETALVLRHRRHVAVGIKGTSPRASGQNYDEELVPPGWCTPSYLRRNLRDRQCVVCICYGNAEVVQHGWCVSHNRTEPDVHSKIIVTTIGHSVSADGFKKTMSTRLTTSEDPQFWAEILYT
jgi:hypothetical protein